ncbi:MAG TPA: ATPase, T2SS/T4P/T4SS family [Phycisphaerae bacterium]|jgi:type IV pilus assembly protein PilB|nr:Flp pilus assembly complex ATPase component TadA [Phycisphaerae bacterium]HOB76321.1 ATPase, T2SS/T4P/T4SS family [Phycisphaerae bacterium]HOJ55486.1 ATPase, T2SS/T4P/T4SS family [Phycisphaerae bacterium]HOL25995.1 ATPase, T2SS/T4P/T4SS family [Phycisphaerae bacterium]HPP22721.1 ATPase, T2SS/T4P/T4SS family [Phycisphaerae bacterium]
MLAGGNKLGQILVQSGHITEADLERALNSQKQTGEKLGETLVKLGVLSQSALVKTLATRLGVPGTYLRHGLIDPAVAKLVDREEAERLRVLPMFKVRNRLIVAMAEPQNLPAIDRLAAVTGCEIQPVLALESNIREFAQKYQADEVAVDEFLVNLTESDVEVVEKEGVDDSAVTDIDRMVEGSPIVNLVNLALLSAVRDGASDIHIEPDRKKTRIRYRIDGVLRELMAPPAGMHAAIVSRVKVIGKMDIAEKRLPQEGRVHIVAENREIDLRVSSMPTILGEKIVIRILDKSTLNTEMERLGFRAETLAVFRRMLLRPHGIVLVTGPTGSGKTTTLYSALDLLRSVERNIVTIEDPVEYQLDLINQIQTNDAVGLTFARALRSILRQDPDVIMVGEIRDGETARVAIQAALTGHLVLSTLHTNDCPSSLTRLIDMGVEPYLVASAVNGIVAQRLARTICPSCKTSYYPSPAALADAGWGDSRPRAFQRGEGCRQCHESGFRGRLGIYEVMEIDDQIRAFIHARASEQEIRKYLASIGHLDLRQEGLRMVEAGLSPLEEVLRVTHLEQQASIRAEMKKQTAPAMEPAMA